MLRIVDVFVWLHAYGSGALRAGRPGGLQDSRPCVPFASEHCCYVNIAGGLESSMVVDVFAGLFRDYCVPSAILRRRLLLLQSSSRVDIISIPIPAG